MRRIVVLALALTSSIPFLGACRKPGETLGKGVLVALAQFEVSPEGKVLPKPKAARLDILTKEDGEWRLRTLEDPDSNVFHKAMVYDPGGGRGPAILTLGGTRGMLKMWRKSGSGFTSETIWEKDFGGRFSRMRDAEAGNLLGDGRNCLAVATHDQGVVAVVCPSGGTWEVTELDRQKDTIVHEIELGDLDADGKIEIYATPSEPNRLDGTPQPGKVVRYDPRTPASRTVVADLGDRHAKEILVSDADGDGRDELYVSVEANNASEQVEIRRYDAGTDPTKGALVATIPDRLSRCMSVGDIDGDKKKEIVLSAFKSGIWLLRPVAPGEPWQASSIAKDSSGFEHASLLADLDGDGRDELYVASDDQGEMRRYSWDGTAWTREVLEKRQVPKQFFTWNLSSAPIELVR